MDSTDEVLAKHKRYLMEYAKLHQIQIDIVYEEVVSGESIAARPQMQVLLTAVQARKYGAVLCMDIDRLGRGNMQDQGTILDAFRESETLIITPDKTYDLTDETDEQLTEFKAFMSRQEYKIIRKRMRRGLMQTIQAGGYISNEPYGYKKITIDKKPSLEIVPEEAEFVRYAYRRYAEGIGAHTISYELNAMGSVPRREAQWGRSTVRNMLRNPTYKGMVAWNRVKRNKPGTAAWEKQKAIYMKEKDWILVPGLHEAIIPPDEWDKVQQIRVNRHIPSQKTGEVKNPLAGLVYCANCGKHIQMMGQNKKIPYLLCNTKGCCAGAKLEYVESAVVDALSDMLQKLKIRIDSGECQDTSEDRAVLESFKIESEKLEKRKSRLYEFLEDGTYTKAVFRARIGEIEQRQKDIVKQIESLESKISRAEKQNLEAVANNMENLLSLYPVLSPGDKNRMYKKVIKKITYSKAKKSKPCDFLLEIETVLLR